MTHRLLVLPLAAAALAAAAIPAAAASAVRSLPGAEAPSLRLPVALPGDVSASAARADRSHWLVGARAGPASRALAARYGARALTGGTGYTVPTAKARAFAAVLRRRGLLSYAQPDGYRKLTLAVADDPLSIPPNAWRASVADPKLTPPPVTDSSPLIALVDAQLDLAHPEFQGGHVSTFGGLGVTNLHGTATAAVAAAPKNDVGILGVWPGARALNVPLPDEIRCSDSAKGISRAVAAGAAVINMSYGSEGMCAPEFLAIENAVRHGVVPVAAAGNEFNSGNPVEFPASLPHVLTVAAVGRGGKPTSFSNRNAAVDLSAPGRHIMTAVPPALDDDGTQDGWEQLSGTSFSAPMVAAAVAWVRAARPDLTSDQLAQVIRLSARDVGKKGWDPDTGFGVLSVGRALTRRAPAADPLEPNDNIEFVDGRRFGTPAPLMFDGRKRATLTALVDAFEDPTDVYRIRVLKHSSVRVTARPLFGNPLMATFAGAASSVNRHRLHTSRHSGRRTERITVRNRGRKSHIFYVALGVQKGRTLDSSYRLTVRRP